MSQTEAPFSSEPVAAESEALSVPSKAFIIGEYAVLSDAPSLVATFGPRFEGNLVAAGEGTRFHSESPVARLLRYAREQSGFEYGLDFVDPFQGEGGFGASTAQFALAFGMLVQNLPDCDLTPVSARRLYRKLMSDQALPPSGVDLVAQWTGGVVCFDPLKERVEQCFSMRDWSDLLVFSATTQTGRKVATHLHLAQLSASGLLRNGAPAELIRWIEQALGNLKDPVELGTAMTGYARALQALGLELPAARDDREALGAQPGVLGCKGTGALLADGLVMLLEPQTSAREAIIQTAQARGLKLVANGLGAPQPGFSAGGGYK